MKKDWYAFQSIGECSEDISIKLNQIAFSSVISRNILQCNVYFLPANPNQERKNSKFVVKVDILSWRELAPSW